MRVVEEGEQIVLDVRDSFTRTGWPFSAYIFARTRALRCRKCRKCSNFSVEQYARDLNSRFETEPGLKDITKLKQFLEELRIKS